MVERANILVGEYANAMGIYNAPLEYASNAVEQYTRDKHTLE